MYLHTIPAIVDDIFDKLSKADVDTLKTTPKDRLGMYHMSWGMGIRNHYGLWHEDHPITKNWHADESSRNIQNGVDYSEDHPDQVSMKIIEGVWAKANA